ncbi:MAG: transcription antitermination factor NusB [Nitrospirae bacterium]|nr:transcription antitermination factor NusB [Nitrospirota bacterium]
MGFRRKAREYALQMLYQCDLNRGRPLKEVLEEFFGEKEVPEDIRNFSILLVEGVTDSLEAIDAQIRSCAENWSLERIAAVDRNILRTAIFEILFVRDIPVRVTLNEAIEIAKKYGQEESASFINGVLDRVVWENRDRVADKQ